jgi:nitrate reductase (cytochrome), electron transfer subunit
MKKEKLIVLTVLLGLFLGTTHLFADQVKSLRGLTSLDEASKTPDIRKVQDDREPIERDYVQQPPLVPHKINGYKINIKFNKCLTCHSWANYKEAGATKISQTHFNDRENNVLANISARRYFCTQCHVPQVNANPLVENTFKPITTIRHQ